jgi:glycosyltransferase involved in cell wall biosynthesis
MIILELCLSPDSGGLELYMRDFSRWLSDRKNIRLFLALKKNSRLDQDLSDLNIPTLYLKSTATPVPLIRAQKLAKFIEKNRIDVVHVHWKSDLFLSVLAKKLARRPIALIHTRQMMVPGKKRDPYHGFIYHEIDRVIAITQQIARQARENLGLPVEKISQIYYGIRPSEKLRPEAVKKIKEKLHIKNRFTVGLVGRIDWYKAQYLMIDALAILKKKGLNLQGIIVGHAMDPGYLEVLKKQINEQNVADMIRFIDFTDNPQELMQCFDVLILPTHVETFGLVLAEAMGLGIPVIGSNAGGVLEIIDDEQTGLLFETKNAESLASAIERLMRNTGLRLRLSAAGEEKAKREYDTDRQHEKVLKVMSDAASFLDQAAG